MTVSIVTEKMGLSVSIGGLELCHIEVCVCVCVCVCAVRARLYSKYYSDVLCVDVVQMNREY